MNVLIKRGAALLMRSLLALLGRWGVGEPSSEASQEIETWLGHSLELLLNLGALGVSGWLQGKGSALRGSGRHPGRGGA